MSEKIRALNLYLFVSNIDESLAFYRLLDLSVEKVSESFARASLGDEVILEFGTSELTSSYDPGYIAPPGVSKGTINFELESSEIVDDKFRQLVASGYDGYLEPIDALWHARFAIVLDPDRNQVGLHGPRSLDEDRKRERGVA